MAAASVQRQVSFSAEDIAKMSVAELKGELRKLEKPLSGTKSDLIARLKEALEVPDAPANGDAGEGEAPPAKRAKVRTRRAASRRRVRP